MTDPDMFPLDELLSRLRQNFGDDSRNQEEAAYWIERYRALLEECREVVAMFNPSGRRPPYCLLERIDAAIKGTTDQPSAAEQKLWLWRNGDHFLAFEHLYPCFTPGGDPMTLGEPVGYAVFKRSFDRTTFKSEPAKGKGRKLEDGSEALQDQPPAITDADALNHGIADQAAAIDKPEAGA